MGTVTISNTLNISLWAAQILIALGFCGGGLMKVFMPISKLSNIWPWTSDLRVTYVRGLGIIDIAGGMGVVVPAIARTMPGLTAAAAFGCVLLQICAIIFHIYRREISGLPVNMIFLVLSLFIFFGRWAVAPI